jgi:hypothetical protein
VRRLFFTMAGQWRKRRTKWAAAVKAPDPLAAPHRAARTATQREWRRRKARGVLLSDGQFGPERAPLQFVPLVADVKQTGVKLAGGM